MLHRHHLDSIRCQLLLSRANPVLVVLIMLQREIESAISLQSQQCPTTSGLGRAACVLLALGLSTRHAAHLPGHEAAAIRAEQAADALLPLAASYVEWRPLLFECLAILYKIERYRA